MAVILVSVHIENFTKQTQLIGNYILKVKNVALNVASPNLIFFQNLIRIKRLMLGFNPTH